MVKEIEANLCFAIFGKNLKIQNGRHFRGGEIFFKLPRIQCSNTCGSKILTSRTVKEIEANLCFAKKFKMAAIFGEGKNFGKLQRVHSLDTLWVENFDEIALSRTVKEIEANLCFAIFGKNSKWPPFLGRGKFLENCKEYTP